MRQGIPTVIVAQRTLLREGLALLLDDSDFTVTANVATVEEVPDLTGGETGLLIVALAKGTPNDLQMLEKAFGIKQDYKVVALAEETDPAARLDIDQIMRNGVDAYLLNIDSREALLKSLELTLVERKIVVLGDKYENIEAIERDSAATVLDSSSSPSATTLQYGQAR